MLHHIVLFRLLPHCSAAAIAQLQHDFAALPAQIPQLRSFHYGVDISTENRQHGFSHGWLLTFDDAAALQHYLAHPAHQAFVASSAQVVADVLVFDFLH